MPMMDGNPDKPQEIVAKVDSMGIAQLVRQLQKQDAAAAPQESRFQKKINSLLSTNTVDKDNLSEITDLMKAALEDQKEELKQAGNQTGAQSTQSRYEDAVSDALEKYTEGDDALEHISEDLHARVIKKLSKDPAVMEKFNRGQLDKRQVTAAAKEVVEDFSKNVLKRDKSAKGPAINSGVPGTAASKAIENSNSAGSIDDITEPHRREAYFKFNALLKRSRVPADKAHEKAYAMATKQYKKAGSAA